MDQDGKMLEKCPRSYLKWTFVLAGMTFVFLTYIVYSNLVPDGSF